MQTASAAKQTAADVISENIKRKVVVFMKKTIVALLSIVAMISSFIPTVFAESTFPKVNTFTEATFAPFSERYGVGTQLVNGFYGKTKDDSSMKARRYSNTDSVRITINESIPVAGGGEEYVWKYVKYSFNYLIENNDNAVTYLGDNTNKAISTQIGADKMKAGQWNHVDYVVGFQKRTAGSTNSNYEVFTYLNGEYIGTTGGDIGNNGNTFFDCSGTNALGITFFDSNKAGYNIYIDDIEFMPYTEAYNGKTTADSLVSMPAPTIDASLASVRNGTVYPFGELNVSDIKDARVYRDNRFNALLTEGKVSVGNVIVAEKDGVIAYYTVTDVPNNYEVLLSDDFSSGKLDGVITHPIGNGNGFEFVSGLGGKKADDKSVNLIKGRDDVMFDYLHFACVPKANSYLSVDFMFMPTEQENFATLRLMTGSSNNFASAIDNQFFNMNRWNKVKYIIHFDENLGYTTKSYVNGRAYETGNNPRGKSNLNGYMRIGVTGKPSADGKTTGVCTTTYIDDISVVEYTGAEPAPDVMPELEAPAGTTVTKTGAIVGTLTIDGSIDVSSLSGTNGEQVRAYLYDENTRALGEQITAIDAAAPQIVVVEGANGAMSYYYVQPVFSIGTSLRDSDGLDVGENAKLTYDKYTYTVTATNNGDSDKEIFIAMGRYDKDGTLLNVAFEQGIIAKNTNNFKKELSIDLSNAEDLDRNGDYIAVFAWDTSLTPYKMSFRTK